MVFPLILVVLDGVGFIPPVQFCCRAAVFKNYA